MMNDPAEPDGPDDGDLDWEEVQKRLHDGVRGGEFVDPPTGDGCWHEEQFYPEGSIAAIDHARLICRAGRWQPVERPPVPFEGIDDPFAEEIEPDS